MFGSCCVCYVQSVTLLQILHATYVSTLCEPPPNAQRFAFSHVHVLWLFHAPTSFPPTTTMAATAIFRTFDQINGIVYRQFAPPLLVRFFPTICSVTAQHRTKKAARGTRTEHCVLVVWVVWVLPPFGREPGHGQRRWVQFTRTCRAKDSFWPVRPPRAALRRVGVYGV
jgi:hypothetical protein